ncbi:MAG TPA: hypothetical protein PKB10_02165, partial [Tepidisphaeraceae bacterium]|nr:hypothetical protein [Tepidisphaeraceae bacterium]
GYRNVMVDLKNEIMEGDGILKSRGIHELLQIARATTLNGRRLPVATSTHPAKHLPQGDWPKYVDVFMPHGNDSLPDAWRSELRALKRSDVYRAHPRPVCCNEDSVDLCNLSVSVEEGCSWGYYDQGFGCGQKQGKFDWSASGRESTQSALSGFQTLPVNWSLNTPHKRAFFARIALITGADPQPGDTPGQAGDAAQNDK